jgi:hydrogenase nickel incorporation protein HypA/HybF
MHELGISRNVVAIVGEAARGRRVRRVTLEIGKLSGVMREAIEFSFDLVAQGTPVAGAVLAVREIDGRARCIECEAEFAVPSFPATCACGSRRLRTIAGEELNIKSIDLED